MVELFTILGIHSFLLFIFIAFNHVYSVCVCECSYLQSSRGWQMSWSCDVGFPSVNTIG